MDNPLVEARYAALTWNAPLSESHADELLGHLRVCTNTSIVDLGCGWGELLLRAAARIDHGTATGIDTDAATLSRGRQAANDRGLTVSFIEQKATDWEGTRDRAICIGSSHTLGGSRAMLTRLAEIVPHGRVLVGDMCWERPPTEAARAAFGNDIPTLADLVVMCREAGWQVLHLSTADQREWDDFESRHRAGLREWLLANPKSPHAAEINEQQNTREKDYLTVYRGVLGFAYLILGR